MRDEQPIFAAGLDAGSQTTRLAVCLVENDRLRCVACAETASDGWVKGKIADQSAIAESIVRVLREAETQSGISLESVTVGMGGPTVRGANGRGVIELGYTRAVDQRDVNRVVERASRVQLQEDRMVLQLFLQDFVVDGHPGHRDPRKMMASRLEINVHLITASIQEHTALVGAVNQAHLAVEETVFEALAAGYAAVKPEDRREGTAVVDIGAHSTELVVYYGDALHLASTVAICGDHFTRDLARGLCLSFEDAETAKHAFGCAQAGSTPENVYVELPTPEDREPKEAPRRLLNRILEARAEELFGFVHQELARVSMERAMTGGIFLTGGGAMLPDMCDVVEDMFPCQARYGLPVGIQGWPETWNDPSRAAVAGLAMYSAKLKSQTEKENRRLGPLARILR